MDLIQAFKDRQRVTRIEYGTVLKSNNGRNPLIDAFQEKLDTCLYIRQAIEECIDRTNDTWQVSDKFWVDKEPKPYEVAESPGKPIIDLVVADLKSNMEHIFYNRCVPLWLFDLYDNEIKTTRILYLEILKLKGKYSDKKSTDC